MRFLAGTVYHSCIILLLVVASTSWAQPVPIKNHSPAFFGLLYPEPEAASTVGKGKFRYGLEFDYSNIFYLSSSKEWRTNVDMELAQFTLDIRMGTAVSNMEVGVRQPFFHAGGGFMDDFILDYHEALGLHDYPDQRAAPRGRYLYEIEHNGLLWNVPDPYRFSYGDTTVWIKKELYKGEIVLTSLKLLAQAPTASTTTGFGNGAWEKSAVFMFDISGDTIDTTVNAGITDPGYIDRGERLDINNFLFAHAAFTYGFTKRLSVIVQWSTVSSPYTADLTPRFKKRWSALTFGLRYFTVSKKEITIGLLEDLSETGPDFTVHISYGN